MLSFKPIPQPSCGCPRCDGLRRLTGKPNAKCLRHDETIPQAWREQFKIPLEPMPGKEKADVDGQ